MKLMTKIASTHLNRNLICAVDIETTGLIPGTHEIVQLALIPLAPDLTPSTYFKALELRIKPDPNNRRTIDPDYKGLNRRLIVDASLHGMERWPATDYFRKWFEGLRLPPGRLIVPLGCNYEAFDLPFLVEFFGGIESYREFFRSDVRDVQRAATMLNDMADWRSVRVPFPKVNLAYLCSCLDIENEQKHDAVYDARASAEVYRKMMRLSDTYVDKPTLELDRWYELVSTQYAEYRITCRDTVPMTFLDFKNLWELTFGKAETHV